MKNVLAFALLAFLFTSCKKDDDNNTAAGKLEKFVQVEGGDSTTIVFAYDANGRTSGYKIYYLQSGMLDSFTTAIVRDGSGRITQITDIEHPYPPNVSRITYNGSSTQIRTIIDESGTSRDSTFVVYNGNTINQYLYWYDPSTAAYDPGGRTEYTVQNGNVVTIKNYDIATGSLDWTETNTFDDKPSAANRSIEEKLILSLWEPGFKNNIVKTETVQVAFPGPADVETISYTYTASGQPATAQVTSNFSAPMTIKYFYK